MEPLPAKLKPAIVVVAYNRPESLSRLLGSLSAATYPQGVPLVISIDKGDNEEVQKLAGEFSWPHGEKQVICQEENLGLRRHILQCGDLSQQYGAIVLLEDDLYVSPLFYTYLLEALQFYGTDDRIAGISLYTNKLTVPPDYPFIPLQDGTDAFFLQIPSSWGQAWTHSQWQAFRSWYDTRPSITATDLIPAAIKAWSEKSWKKYFTKYLVETDKFFVYPRVAYSTNFGDVGTHYQWQSCEYQVELQLEKKQFLFRSLDDSYCLYDAFHELRPEALNKLTPLFQSYTYAVNLYGGKPLELLGEPYVLSVGYSEKALFHFGMHMQPHEMNILANSCGNELVFCHKENLRQHPNQLQRKDLYFYSNIAPKSVFRLFKFWVNRRFREKLRGVLMA